MTIKHYSISLLCALIATSAMAKNTDIMTIQGNGASSPLVTQGANSSLISVEGSVTAIQKKPLGKDVVAGFYVQDVVGDNSPLTSDGVFVVAQNTQLSIGDNVKVTGHVSEKYGLTHIQASKVSKLGSTATIQPIELVPHPTDKDFAATLERYEGMLVTITPKSNMVVSRSFGFDRKARRNNMALSYGKINHQANQFDWPSSKQSIAQYHSNLTRNLTVESQVKARSGLIPWYKDFASTSKHHIRIGDAIKQLTGVIGFSHGQYRLYVTQPATAHSFVHSNPRTSTPQLKQGDVSVATFNVLNYFNSPFGGAQNPTNKSRGASSKNEFTLQANKIVSAITALDSDIIGLMEIENNGYGKDSALNDLVTRINNKLPPHKQYRFAQIPNKNFIGSGAITNQVIYRPDTVTLNDVTLIAMPVQRAPEVGKESGKNFMRDALTPTFTLNKSGEKLTVSINHFKSKGSTCWEDVALQQGRDSDHQGSCEHFRVSGAYHLGQQLAQIDGHKLIIGDLNSYANEDPLLVLTNRDNLPSSYKIDAARDTFVNNQPLHGNKGAVIHKSFGYINTVAAKHPNAFGYSYKNVVGTLDYILASPSLSKHIVDAVEWNINSPESTLFEYPSKYTGKMKKFSDPYRSSDHDPIIVSLSFK